MSENYSQKPSSSNPNGGGNTHKSSDASPTPPSNGKSLHSSRRSVNEKDDGEDHFISEKDSIIMSKHHYEHFLKTESAADGSEEDDKDEDITNFQSRGNGR